MAESQAPWMGLCRCGEGLPLAGERHYAGNSLDQNRPPEISPLRATRFGRDDAEIKEEAACGRDDANLRGKPLAVEETLCSKFKAGLIPGVRLLRYQTHVESAGYTHLHRKCRHPGPCAQPFRKVQIAAKRQYSHSHP